MYLARSVAGPKGRELQGVVGPDENGPVNNDLYTNLLAGWLDNRFIRGLKGTDVWKNLPYKLPQDAKSLLTYDDDLVLAYQQAAAILSVYPLQYPPAEKAGRTMMDRFANKVSKNGPAMTDSVHAIVWARLGGDENAYQAWHASWQPFTKSPLLLFSEKSVIASTYFTTGAAGSLQAVLFGFLGFRIDYDKEPGATWASPLQDGNSWLSIKPRLPAEWKSVKFKNFTVLGRRYNLTATHEGATVTTASGD